MDPGVFMEQQLGAEAKLKVELINGKAVLTVSYGGSGAEGALSLSLNGEYFVNKIFELIPGDSVVEQMAKAIILQALKAAKV